MIYSPHLLNLATDNFSYIYNESSPGPMKVYKFFFGEESFARCIVQKSGNGGAHVFADIRISLLTA